MREAIIAALLAVAAGFIVYGTAQFSTRVAFIVAGVLSVAWLFVVAD